MKASLHSNLVIFKYIPCLQSQIPTFPLHSNLVIFKLKKQTELPTIYHLYIPIWLYSNIAFNINLYGDTFFTFQSGYIQIAVAAIKFYKFVTFTFQSGYIQMELSQMVVQFVLNFTFQSGYIQMVLPC